jgi:transketolase
LYLDQDEAYREAVLPFGTPVLGITAGLRTVFQGLEGVLGDVISLERFGASANFKVLDEKFGYTPQVAVQRAKALLASVPERLARLKKLTAKA